jgi:hypothetical protein
MTATADESATHGGEVAVILRPLTVAVIGRTYSILTVRIGSPG